MRAAALGPELAHNLDILAGALGATVEGNTQRLELFRQPPDADAKDEASAAETVDGRDGLGEHERVVFGYEADTGPEPNLSCAGRRICQGRERIGDRGICRSGEFAAGIRVLRRILVEQHNMLRRPNRRKTKPLGGGSNDPDPFRVDCRTDTNSEISDLHSFLHRG